MHGLLLRAATAPRASTHPPTPPVPCAAATTTAPGLKYEDELLEDIKQRTAPNDKPEKPLRKVGGGGGGLEGCDRQGP